MTTSTCIPERGLVVRPDRATRRAVQKALRTGGAQDARTDGLARDAAARNLRHTWILWMIVGGVVLQVVGAALEATEGALTTRDVALLTVMAVSAILAIGSAGLTRRRSRRYLRRARTAA